MYSEGISPWLYNYNRLVAFAFLSLVWQRGGAKSSSSVLSCSIQLVGLGALGRGTKYTIDHLSAVGDKYSSLNSHGRDM